jgi:hypothetical protein
MTQYLLAFQQPDGPPPADLDMDAVMRDVNAIREDMQSAGVWVFSGGLHAPETATVIRKDGDEIITTDGPYAEGKEHIGGLTIVDVDDLDAALEWGRKLTGATRLPVEVRPFQH